MNVQLVLFVKTVDVLLFPVVCLIMNVNKVTFV